MKMMMMMKMMRKKMIMMTMAIVRRLNAVVTDTRINKNITDE